MAETFKQLKRSEDSVDSGDVTMTGKKIQKTARALGGRGDDDEDAEAGNQDQDAAMMEEDKVIKERTEGKSINKQKYKEIDDEDIISEGQQEIMQEVNEMDGRVKISKDVQTYEDQDNEGKDGDDDGSQSQTSVDKKE